jgi:hypothetical protein
MPTRLKKQAPDTARSTAPGPRLRRTAAREEDWRFARRAVFVIVSFALVSFALDRQHLLRLLRQHRSVRAGLVGDLLAYSLMRCRNVGLVRRHVAVRVTMRVCEARFHCKLPWKNIASSGNPKNTTASTQHHMICSPMPGSGSTRCRIASRSAPLRLSSIRIIVSCFRATRAVLQTVPLLERGTQGSAARIRHAARRRIIRRCKRSIGRLLEATLPQAALSLRNLSRAQLRPRLPRPRNRSQHIKLARIDEAFLLHLLAQ